MKELYFSMVLDKLTKCPRDLSLHPQRVVLVDILQVVIIVKVLGDGGGVTEALDDAVHEARVAEVAEAADARLGLVTHTRVTVARARAEVVFAGAGAAGAGHGTGLLLVSVTERRRGRGGDGGGGAIGHRGAEERSVITRGIEAVHRVGK